MLNNKWSSLCSLCLYFQHIPIRFVIFPNLEFSRSNFSPSRWWTLCRAALIIDIFIMLLSCTGWFSFLLKCRINLEIASERIVYQKPKSRKCEPLLIFPISTVTKNHPKLRKNYTLRPFLTFCSLWLSERSERNHSLLW